MVGDAAAKKRKRGGKVDPSGPAAAAAEAVSVAPEAAVAAAAAAAVTEDGRKKKKKKKRKRQQALEGEREGAIDAGLSSATCDHGTRTASGSKRPKKGQRQPGAGTGTGAAVIATVCGTPSVDAAVPSQLSSLACTSKAAEYAAVDAGQMSPPAQGPSNTKTDQNKKKKAKAKKDKRDKKHSRGTPPSHATHTPPPPTGRVDETTSSENPHPAAAAAAAAANHDDNSSHDDGPVLEGIVHDGAMYLVDAGRKVFSAQRDEQGNLVEVGTYDKDHGRVVMMDPASLPAAGPSSSHDSAEKKAGAGAAAAGSGKKRTKGKGKGKKGGTEAEEASEKETGTVVDYPFEVEECDHCETSERAYADIAPLLSALAAEVGKTPEELVIYDPYYCQGSTVARLASLGFPRVYNRKEDFYEVVKNGTVPKHDVVVTNPPFSGEHVLEILRFCARKGARPWFLLLPNYVYLKDYYESSLGRGPGRSATLPFYLTPPKRYMYYSPAGSRLQVKSSERKTSPFNTFWYIRLGDGGVTSKILQSYDAVSRKADSEARCCIARTTQQIPYKMMDSNDPRRKKARDRQRSIDRIRKKKSEWVLS